MLRKTANEHQYLNIQMRDEKIGDLHQGEDYWTVRSRLPPDVLRDIQRFWPGEGSLGPDTRLSGVSRIDGEMLAHGGLERLAE